MIHRFCINNFQSIREAVELDFRIPGTTPEMPCFRKSRSRPDVRLPSSVVLVGPNGSGKSTLLRAMVETIRFVAYSYGNQSGNIPGFLPFLSLETLSSSTRVEVDFDAFWFKSGENSVDSLLRYTLELEREEKNPFVPRVGHEALYSFPKGRPRRLLERKKGQPVYVAKEIGLRPRDDRLSSIPDNASVISSLARMGVGSFLEVLQDINGVQTNVSITDPDPWRPDTQVVTHYYRDRKDLVEKISNKLRRFDLGIKDMNLQPTEDGEWLLTFEHHGLSTPIILPKESAGTRHLVHTFPSLNYAIDTGQLAIMDALDSDFHTELSVEIINWFRRKETNPIKAQLFCALHNLSILDDLEKEEIFIVEKDRSGTTRVHGARDVAGLRRGTNLQKQYRSGALGGLPAFG